MSEKESTIAGYFPVFHAGYLELLENHPDAQVNVLGSDILEKRFNYLRKDIRALTPEQSVAIISGLERTVRVIGEKSLKSALSTSKLIMPDDDISHSLAEEFGVKPVYDPVFLRWDRLNTSTNVEVVPDRTVTIESNDPIIQTLTDLREKSTNWWRHVAAVVVKDGEVIAASHNSSMPTSFSSAIDNDPRITASRGVAIEASIDMHAEARVIANLAKNGYLTQGSEIFVTTFPCPNCAKLIAECGINSCYFIEGYAMLDGQSILKANNVEIVKILTEAHAIDTRTLKPYPTN